MLEQLFRHHRRRPPPDQGEAQRNATALAAELRRLAQQVQDSADQLAELHGVPAPEREDEYR